MPAVTNHAQDLTPAERERYALLEVMALAENILESLEGVPYGEDPRDVISVDMRDLGTAIAKARTLAPPEESAF